MHLYALYFPLSGFKFLETSILQGRLFAQISGRSSKNPVVLDLEYPFRPLLYEKGGEMGVPSKF